MYAERKPWPLTGTDVELSYLVPDRSNRLIDRVITLHGPLKDNPRATLAEIADKTQSPRRYGPEPTSAPRSTWLDRQGTGMPVRTGPPSGYERR